MDLILDNYYKLTYSSSILYFKYKGVNDIDGDILIITDNYIIDRGEYIKSDEFYLDDDDIIVNATINDVISFLPKNHPERIAFRKNRINNLLNM